MIWGLSHAKLLSVSLPIFLLGAILGSCSPSKPMKLIVFAAAGAKPAVDEICQKFEGQHRCTAEINYGGGGDVLSRMTLSHSGDVYVAPEQGFMEAAKEKGAIESKTVTSVAYMIPVIAVRKGNPKQITCLSDLAKPGMRLAITRPETTLLGKLAPEIFEKARLSEAIGKNTVTMASDPNNLLTMLFMGSIDAGVTWNFFGTSASDKIEIIWLSPEQLTGIGQMQVAVSSYSQNTVTAHKFIDFLTSSQGKDIFKRYGYLTSTEEVKKYWR